MTGAELVPGGIPGGVSVVPHLPPEMAMLLVGKGGASGRDITKPDGWGMYDREGREISPLGLLALWRLDGYGVVASTMIGNVWISTAWGRGADLSAGLFPLPVLFETAAFLMPPGVFEPCADKATAEPVVLGWWLDLQEAVAGHLVNVARRAGCYELPAGSPRELCR